ncbi:hypothetical protein ACJJTC_018989 [Scirpophaga incertulas]
MEGLHQNHYTNQKKTLFMFQRCKGSLLYCSEITPEHATTRHKLDYLALSYTDSRLSGLPTTTNIRNTSKSNLCKHEHQETQEDETEENLDVENDAGPSHDEALHALEIALKCNEMTMTKRKSGLRQMTITKYFKPN